MIKTKRDFYYTFRIVSAEDERLRVACSKWEEFGNEPIETYHVTPDGRGLGACTCPAWSLCKHSKAVGEALLNGQAQEFWKWKYVEGKVEGHVVLIAIPVDDIKTIEELTGDDY